MSILLTSLLPPALDHSSFCFFSWFWFLKSIFSCHLPSLSRVDSGWEPAAYGKLLLLCLVKPTAGASPSLPPDLEPIPIADLPSTLPPVLFGIFLCHWPEGILSHIWDSLAERQSLKSLWGTSTEKTRGFQALSRFQGWNSCSTIDHPGATGRSLTRTRPCVFSYKK